MCIDAFPFLLQINLKLYALRNRFISSKLNIDKENDGVIDLGCGNGMMLAELSKAGFRRLTGVDYSNKAIELCKKVLSDEGIKGVDLQVFDVLKPASWDHKFKLAHDKGTYDAISLCPDDPKDKREKYIRNVHGIIEDKGYLALTSCNWTKPELIEHLKNFFEFAHELPTKTFSFGGQSGNTITQVIFTKRTIDEREMS